MQEFLENMEDVLEEVTPENINADAIFRELEGWDSLTALSLIAMVDQEYDIKLTGSDIQSSVSLEDIYNIIKAKA